MSAALIMREMLEGHPVTFVAFGGQPVVVARELATALGYADPALLSRKIRGDWSADFVEGKDYRVLDCADLSAFKAAWPDMSVTDTSGLDRTRRALTVLTESGLWLVSLRTEAALGTKLRRLLADSVLPKLARGEGIPAAGSSTNELAEHFERLGDKAAAVGDKVGAGKFYRASGEARGLPFRRARRVEAPPALQVPLLTVGPPMTDAPAAEDVARLVSVWHARYGSALVPAAGILPLAMEHGLFRIKLVSARNDHARATTLGDILRGFVDHAVGDFRITRRKSGSWGYQLITITAMEPA